MVDLFFFYKYVIRSIILFKSNNIKNTYEIPNLSKIILFFSVSKIEDLNLVQAYNYSYLFRFFLGRKAFFTKQKSFFSLGKWTYSFNISLIISNNNLYYDLFYLINDVFSKVENGYKFFGLYSRKLKIFYLVLKDLNIFSEQKTNLGLFYLDHFLNIHFFIKTNNFLLSQKLFKNLKLNFY